MRYLLDTNIAIRALEGHKPEADFVEKQITKNAVAISVVVIAEFYGKERLSALEQELFSKLITTSKVFTIEEDTAKIAGTYRRQFLRKTKKVFLQDCFLAAQAKQYNLTLVTNNKADFPMRDIQIISP